MTALPSNAPWNVQFFKNRTFMEIAKAGWQVSIRMALPTAFGPSNIDEIDVFIGICERCPTKIPAISVPDPWGTASSIASNFSTRKRHRGCAVSVCVCPTVPVTGPRPICQSRVPAGPGR